MKGHGNAVNLLKNKTIYWAFAALRKPRVAQWSL
jgi:hypothetical protein